MKISFGKVFYGVTVALILFITSFGQTKTEPICGDIQGLEFRYTIVADASRIQRYVNSVGDYRHIVILIEDDAFDEQNLRKLFYHLSRRYEDRTGLYADVYTTLDAVPTPEEYDQMNLYGPKKDYRLYKNAQLSRNRSGYAITIEIPGTVKRKRVWLGFDLVSLCKGDK